MGLRQEIDNPMVTDRVRYYRAPHAFKRCECGQAKALYVTERGGLLRCETCRIDEGLSMDEVMTL